MDDSIIVKAIQYFADWQKFTQVYFLNSKVNDFFRNQMTGGEASKAQQTRNKK